jgi:hypothetical protein
VQVVYNVGTNKYVMWFHLDHKQERKPHYHWRLVAVATADNPNGPFHLHHAFHPSGLPSLDVSLYQVPADDPYGNKVPTTTRYLLLPSQHFPPRSKKKKLPPSIF